MKYLYASAILLVLIIDGTAMHDIIRGRESDLLLEYLTIIFSVPAIVYLMYKIKNRNSQP